MSGRLYNMKQLGEGHEEWSLPSNIIRTKADLIASKTELLARIQELEAENAFLKKVRDRLVCDVVAAAQDYGAPMSDCRLCDYTKWCARKSGQYEPDADMCEAAVLKACEEE